jgi:ABC-type branched-subunit amino acid transport system ATPase component/ABC-type branched-subunit amino acid transport system permease subunit
MIGPIAIRFDVVAIGAMAGLGYAILASGLVLVYRASRVINLAHGQVGAFCATLFAVLVDDWKIPYAAALPLAIVAGAAVGWLIERGLVRPLVERSHLAVLVATIGVTDLLLVAAAKLPSVTGESKHFPTPFNATVTIHDLVLHGEHFALLIFGPVVLVLFTTFMARSRYGLAIRGVADNREAAELAGIPAPTVSSIVWVLAGGLAAIAAILTLPLTGATQVSASATGTALGPALLLRALAAGLAGRMTKLPATLAAGISIGVVQSVLYASYPSSLGITDVVLFVFIVAMLLLRSRGQGDPGDSLTFGKDPVSLAANIRNHPTVRLVRRGSIAAAMIVIIVLPLVVTSSSRLYLLSLVPIYAIIGISIVILTGWAGQLSLCQMAFVGIGAMGTAALNSRGVPFGAAVGDATVVGILIAVVVGAPALRLRGLFLTVTSLGFAVAASSYLLNLSVFSSSDIGVAEVSPGKLGPINLNSFRVDFYVCAVCLLGAVLIARRIRATGFGRSLIAVEGNEDSATAMTVSPAVAKIAAFAVAGGMATFAGGLFAAVSRTFEATSFAPEQSLQLLAMTVVGGIGSVGGAVLGAIYIVGLPDIFGNSVTVQLAVSGIGLLIILRLEPTGLIGAWERLRDFVVRRFLAMPADTDAQSGSTAQTSPTVIVQRSGTDTAQRSASGVAGAVAALVVRDVVVDIGGRRILSGVDIDVRDGEVVGLIGCNGAGKSTLVNAISGFVPASGSVELFGEGIDDLSAVDRARLGLGRSFQSAVLFPRLTSRECLQVALASRQRAEVIPSILALPPSVRIEGKIRREAEEILQLLALGPHADTCVGSLSTGTRRIVEFGCMLVARPRVLLLDEPMAGIAQRESESFGVMLLGVRRELGAAMLVIEHDVPLISEISDRLYCLEAGSVIAEGDPTAIRSNPAVIASYLGTDERAIRRSRAMPAKRSKAQVRGG